MATHFRLFDAFTQFSNATGAPYVGGKLTTKAAGTDTNKTTYQDNGGVTPHANPIILDSAGRLSSPVWGTVGAYDLVLTDANDVLIDTFEDIDGINDVSGNSASEWISSGLTPTFVDADTFTLSGDQTTTYHEGRRVLIADSGGTDYGAVTSSSYSNPNTTVNVILDSGGVIDSGISAVSYGLISADNTSAPAGGFMDIIATGSSSAVANIEFLNLSATYIAYRLMLTGLELSADNDLRLQVTNDGGSTWETATQYSFDYEFQDAFAERKNGGINTTGVFVFPETASATNTGVWMADIHIYNPMDANNHTAFKGDCFTTAVNGGFRGTYSTAEADDGFRLIPSAGTLNIDAYTLFGIRGSV